MLGGNAFETLAFLVYLKATRRNHVAFSDSSLVKPQLKDHIKTSSDRKLTVQLNLEGFKSHLSACNI